jgi:hypothetical protein
LNEVNNRRADLAANRVRVMRWFSRDEGSENRWQAMRHYHLLLDGLSVTERGVGANQARYEYMFNPPFLWDGHQPTVTSRVVAPFVRSGCGPAQSNEDVRRALTCLERGVGDDVIVQDSLSVWHHLSGIDYDLHWGNHRNPNNLTGLPAATVASSSATAYYPRVYNGKHTHFSGGGMQVAYESQRFALALRPEHLFRTTPWMANPWLHSDWNTDVDRNRTTPSLRQNGNRQQTGEETRLMLWSQIILGCKGLIMFWAPSIDSLVLPTDYGSNSQAPGWARDVGVCTGIPQANGSRSYATASILANFIHTLGVRDSMLGSDYLYPPIVNFTVPGDPNNTPFWQPGTRLGLRQAFGNAYGTVLVNLGLNPAASPPEEYYIGQHSQRIVVADIADIIHTNRDMIADLQLQSWFSRGTERGGAAIRYC